MHIFVLLGLGVLGLLWLTRPRENASARRFTSTEAREIGTAIGIDWREALFSIEQFRQGLSIELEHGTVDPHTNVTDDDLLQTGKIAWAHLNELPDYYTRLARMERAY